MVQAHVRVPFEVRSGECGVNDEAAGSVLQIAHAAFRTPQFIQDRGVTSSISPCEGDGPGANPGFLTIEFFF